MLHFRSQTGAAQPTRRHFLIGTAATAAGLTVGYQLVVAAPALAQAATAPNPFQAYVGITANNRIVIHSSQFEMGQGSYFGVATLVMEELGGDWSQVDVIGASGNPSLYGNLAMGGAFQGTGGSTSMASSWERYRKAGATARAMLVAAAAKQWNVPESEIKVAAGTLSNASGRTATFGDLATAAAALPVPTNVPLKPRERWTQIGSSTLKRYDSAGKTNGKQPYTIDLKMDGLLTAVMIHPPKFGAQVKSFDASKAKALNGIVDVVQIPRGVAVVGRDMWTALKGRDLTTVLWDESNAEQRGSADLLNEYEKLAKGPAAVTARNDGDVAGAFANAGAGAQTIEAAYEFPYLAHAAIEPLNAVARISEDGRVDVWGGHQMPDLYQAIAAQVAGTTPDKVSLHVMKTGGSFGRRAVSDGDLIAEAVAIAKALGPGKPVKVQWTRENDMRGGRYRPAYVHAMKASLDKDGKLVALYDHIVGQSIMDGGPFAMMIKDGIDPTSVEGAATMPYAIPNLKIDLTTVATKIPVLWWRSVGSTHTAYAVETFIDELAAAAKRDPIDFRLAMLDKHPRHAAVLKLAAEKAGWGTPLAQGRFRGVALHESFSTFVAQVVEITVKSGADFSVDRVVCAVDCGTAINPDQVRAQMEGGIGFGLGAILQEELTLTGGVVDQQNYDTYTPLRINQMPKVEVHIVASNEPPTGVGEPGVPPIGPAVANALRAATGKTVRKLPILKHLST
ncbi:MULTISPECIES: xanthine dehydrogenase family protein molybdopterin-binding subunit [unclassified Beijerinckia]|uniref:xanthine dehydrogenase family protein molybdopterin-binding subunit n=1 Tax=unclassified Beijerinckia TaxID=2638183 RepID=UPI00089815A3|nr:MULTISPECIES: xanthine dehydrogenase family protein molybdopterin-binding subunit [unclassified Beijerinckia]MDH7798016.1 isoquinoline 1-oxidoreductase beta subunit [Beijerinckia sp. GAS462]SED06048.1 isoquinoline 1-oxidoreductase, beta subunit [Beijerinckia sp. 28-YEA-48]